MQRLCYEKLPLSRDRNPNPERNFIKLQIPALRSIDIMRLMGNVVIICNNKMRGNYTLFLSKGYLNMFIVQTYMTYVRGRLKFGILLKALFLNTFIPSFHTCLIILSNII